MDLLTTLILNKLKHRKGGITPTGTINITENGETDVTNYATANVNVIPPPDHTELTYIESSGTQYIDLGILPQANMKFLIDYQFLDNWKQAGSGTTESANMFGSLLFSNTKRFFVKYYTGDEKFGFGIGTNQTSSVNGDTNRHLFTIDTINWRFGVDTTLQNCSSVSFNTDKTFTLFGAAGDFSSFASYGWNNPNYGYMGASRFYGAKIYLGNLLIMDLVPAKDVNGVACIYDKVKKECVYNQGTGNFIAGAEK